MTTYKKSIDFEPEDYLKQVITLSTKASPNLRNFSDKAVAFIKRGIELEFLSKYYAVQSFEGILELDGKVREEVLSALKLNLPPSFPQTRDLPINRQPFIESPIQPYRSPLDVQYTLLDSKVNSNV